MYSQTIAILAIGLSALVLQACQSTGSDTITKKDPEKAVKVRTQLAAEYIRTGDLDAAKRSLDQALEAEPRDSTANMMMGVLLQQEGSKISMEKADGYFKRAISNDSKNAQARNNYGTYLFVVERYNDAIEQLQIAGATLGYDQRYKALENLGRVYLKVGDVANAEKAFKQALQVNRESIIAMVELSELFYLQQKSAQASQLYEQYVRLVGQNNQGARALWIGLRIARANNDQMGMQVLVNQLRALFPESQEYQRYLQLQYSTEAVWK
ncbi:type IV pilus biogenesis/stability protein PilW [Acinetobacter piscicola]|uniref:type IV pilus biogenesis/stability protein PilW n=1 Tax=Acinetobacter piscicola TaxID=2006115 RepID=UPI000B7EB99A|nr:type IV pilus biogenesis/stability protein PilW [Acinetobacter piscicola]